MQEISSDIISITYPPGLALINDPPKYDFDEVETVFFLDPILNEISGLAYNTTAHNLLAHNDEQGFFFELNIDDGSILSKKKFAKPGDYESIEFLDNSIIIAKRNGTLYKYNLLTKETEIHKTELSRRNNIEGLCYDKKASSFLLACKGQALDKSQSKKEKCIYEFDIASSTLLEEPRLIIKDDELKDWVENNYQATSKKDLKKKLSRVKEFSPSGLSFTNNQEALFVISAKGSTIMIFDKNLELSSIQFLNKKTIPQPEGICFDKEDNLYISTEGQGFQGKIFKFSPQ